ncbi:MAG: helix-turn-helix domain-containing protein [Verrucomicrobiota bacterium]
MSAELRFMELNQSLFGDGKWMTKEELARYYRCSPRTINNYMRRRILPYVKIGRVTRFNVAACDQAMLVFQTKTIWETNER